MCGFPHIFYTIRSCGTKTDEERQLRIPEWIELLRLVGVINNTYPDLATGLPCYMELDHASQRSALKCSECYPFVDTDII